MERGCASDGRALTAPRYMPLAREALRSTDCLTLICAVSTTLIVPSTQLLTSASAPLGESAMPVGSDPTAAEGPAVGALLRPVTFTIFCAWRKTTYAVSLSGPMTTCHGSVPAPSETSFTSVAFG